jgi:hypothetical protein
MYISAESGKFDYFIDWSSSESLSFSEEEFCDLSSSDCHSFQINFKQFIIQRDFVACFDIENKKSIKLIAPREIPEGLFNFLRWLLPEKLIIHDKLILHSSCVIIKDNAIVFLGPSGAGKTTTASFFPEESVLGDDMNLLEYCKNKKQFYMQSSLLGQRYFNPNLEGKRFPLKQIFWLKKSKKNSIVSQTNHSMSKLMQSCAQLDWPKMEKKQIHSVMSLIKNLNKIFEMKTLEVSIQGGIDECIRDFLSKK